MAAFNRLQVLVVERDEAVRQAAVSAAQAAGFVVQGCCNHLAPAWDTVLLQKPDVILIGSIATKVEDIIQASWRWVHEYGIAVVHLAADASRASQVIDGQAGECVVVPFSHAQLAVSLRTAMARCKQNAEARSESAAEVLQSLPEALIVTDMAGRIVISNRAAQRLLHKDAVAMKGQSLTEVYRPRHLDGTPAEAVPDRAQTQGLSRLLMLSHENHTAEMIEDRHVVLRDGTGGISGMAVIFRALQRKEVAQRSVGALGDSVLDPLLMLDASARISFANFAAAKMLGLMSDALVGRSLWEMLPAQFRARHEDECTKAWQQEAAHTSEWLLEGTGSGGSTWYEVRSYPHQSGRALWLRDITARKLEWEKGNRIDRLESLGLLARGFAHDFNNLLTVLLGNLSLAEQRFITEGSRPAELHAARQATVQAQGLVQQLLTFARGGVPVKRSVSPTSLVRQFFEQHPRVPGVQYVLETFEETPVLAIDPNQIRRLLGNLIRNAEQACSMGGSIHVRCETATSNSLFPGEVPADESAEVAGVVIEVEDTGEGISPQHLTHIFEPYFTTRKTQNATGLGLTVCESIARAHGGTLNVYGVKPHGTRVRFFLPMEDDSSVPTDGSLLDSGMGAGGGVVSAVKVHPVKPHKPRILVLEDDHLVRALLSRGLQQHGYEVTETLDGHDTVRLYERAVKEGHAFDLVILDLSIPNGMGGLRTIEKLRAIDPRVLAMVSSGYSDDPAMAHPASYGFAAVLPKPYEPQELVTMVQQLLDARMNQTA